MALIESKENLWTLNEFAGHTIRMRNSDGYFNGKDMIKINSKKIMADYLRNQQTKEFVKELEKEVGGNFHLPLIEVITKGANENRGTWVHPKIAIHLAMWISPTFSVKVIDWVHRFLNGDITLVKDIVDRHDAVNNTTSEVLITSLNNKLDEYKSNIQILESSNKNLESTNKNLEIVANNLKSQIDKLNEFRCNYCNKRYSSPAGLTRHLKNCSDKNMCDFKAVIRYDRFLSYIELLNEYEIEGIKISLEDKDTDRPLLCVFKNKKKYKYNIFLNESRWKVIKMLEDYVDFPLELLLSENSLKMFRENEKNYKRIYASLNNDIDFSLEEEFKEKLGLIVGDDLE